MDYEQYCLVFCSLGIPVEPLPENYTPEEYGRQLLSMSQFECGVSYTSSTDYDKMQGKPITALGEKKAYTSGNHSFSEISEKRKNDCL